jgi:sterol desaturase/sphingolipid hydroxylase (fatty acid hydroxylase superfamily)
MDTILPLLRQSLAALTEAATGLVYPALFFLCIGMLAKGPRLFTDMRRALPETALNLQIMVFNLLVVVPLISAGSVLMNRAITGNGLVLISPATWASLPFALTLLVAVFIGDFVGYWRHRLEHTALLWPAHAVHHSDTEMTWLALERFHPINRVTTFAIDTTAILILGFPVEIAIANGLVRHYYGYFIHADLPWTFGPLGRILVSPAMHRWHHAADPQAFDTNYATVFSVFDQAFGTFRVPGPCDIPLGVTDRLAPTLRSQLGYAFTARAYQRLFRRNSSG